MFSFLSQARNASITRLRSIPVAAASLWMAAFSSCVTEMTRAPGGMPCPPGAPAPAALSAAWLTGSLSKRMKSCWCWLMSCRICGLEAPSCWSTGCRMPGFCCTKSLSWLNCGWLRRKSSGPGGASVPPSACVGIVNRFPGTAPGCPSAAAGGVAPGEAAGGAAPAGEAGVADGGAPPIATCCAHSGIPVMRYSTAWLGS
mmetsp:Transcript_12806/g.36217  ORF Transcript_12806/g.36217 Transcript_12806/m.36217 type:complete len:200 (+) Transcript_12806:187-786(+)